MIQILYMHCVCVSHNTSCEYIRRLPDRQSFLFLFRIMYIITGNTLTELIEGYFEGISDYYDLFITLDKR